MEKVNVINKFEDCILEEKEYSRQYSCYRVDDNHVVHKVDNNIISIDRITSETEKGLFIDTTLDITPIYLEIENIKDFNINNEAFVNIIKYLIRVRDKQVNEMID